MKASQSSLYRELENLMLWFIPVGNNIPKDFALRNLGERLQNELLDAMTAWSTAASGWLQGSIAAGRMWKRWSRMCVRAIRTWDSSCIMLPMACAAGCSDG